MSAVVYRVRVVLRRRWKSTVAVLIVVAFMAALTLTLVAGTVRTLTAPNRYVQSFGLTFDTGLEQFEGLPRTTEVQALSIVDSAASITFMFGGLRPADESGPPSADDVDFYDLLDGLVFAGTPDAFGARIVEGSSADPREPGEFVASQSFVRSTGSAIGDRFDLVTISTDQAAASGFDAEPAGEIIHATLVGVFEGSADLADDYPLSVFPLKVLDGTDIGISATQMALDLAPGASVDDLRAQLDTLPRGDLFAIGDFEVVPDPVRAAVRTQGIGLLILAVIGSAAAIVVTGQMLGREVQLPEAQLSTLRTLGMTRDQLRLEALVTAAVPVVVGAILGAVVSVALSDMFPIGFARQVEPSPGIRLQPVVHLLGPVLLAGALLGWLGMALVRSRAVTRPRVTGRGAFASSLPSPQAATAVRFIFSRSSGDVGSPRAQTAGLVVVLVLAIGAMTFGANVARLLDEPARQGLGELGIGAGGGEIPQEVRDRLTADPDVEELTMFAAIVVSAGSDRLDIAGALPVVGEYAPTVLAGRLPVADDEIALGRVAARRLDVGIGDDIDMGGAAGGRTVRVTGLALIPRIEGGEGLGEGGFMTLDGVRTFDPEAPLSVATLRLRSGAPDGTTDRLAELVGMGIGPSGRQSEIINLGRVRSIPFVLVAVLGVLAVLSLAHQLMQSVRRRRRDMAILRALGATRGWVTQVVHWQAILLTLGVFVVAVPLGYIVGRGSYRIVADRIGAQTDVFLPVVSLAVLFAALVVAANIAAAVPSRRVRNLPAAAFLNQE